MATIQQQDILTQAYNKYKSALERYSTFKLNNTALGEDLVQETFLKAWKYIMRGEKIDTMKAFLYHVLNGLIIDKYRKHKTVSLDLLTEKGFEPKEDDSESIYDALDSQRAIKKLDLLPKKYKQLMRMKYAQNLSLEEMSRATGQSKNTVAVQINRGLQKLQNIYNPQ